ncbi:MAG: tRNA dihydrouridine synthase DusB [Anaeroplasmataceae bacterium]
MWKIGDVYIPNKLVLAPMAGITNEAFRVLCKEYGCGLVVAEMVSDKALGFGNEKTKGMTIVNRIEHPVSMQIFGADVESMVNAAKWIDENSDCDIIDINMGCPVNKVAKKAMAGSNLLRDPNKVYEITKAVVDACRKPVTVKIRIGWDEEHINAVENAKLIEQAGAKAIAVHGRTRNQFYSGSANYEVIKAVKEAVSIPVIANGDITDAKKALEVLEYTGCDAIMIGRAAQGNPFIFKEINEYLINGKIIERPSNKVIYDTIMKHYNYLLKLKGEYLACLEMRTHISAYLKGLPGSANIRNMVNMEKDFNKVCEILKNYLIREESI